MKQVRSDQDASELVILGQFGRLFDEFGTLEEVKEVLLIIMIIFINFRLFPRYSNFEARSI